MDLESLIRERGTPAVIKDIIDICRELASLDDIGRKSRSPLHANVRQLEKILPKLKITVDKDQNKE